MSHAIQLMDTRTCLPMARAKRDSVFMEGLSLPRSILLMVTLLTPLRSASCSWVSLASSRARDTATAAFKRYISASNTVANSGSSICSSSMLLKLRINSSLSFLCE